jgi:hypothetical protein
MSFQAMTWAVKQKLPTNQKMVLLMLADRTNRDTGRCTPSHKNLAEDCGMSQATLKRCLAALADAGYISIQARTAEGVNLSNQYILHMSDDTNASVQNEGGGVTVSYKPGSNNQEVEPKDCADKPRSTKRTKDKFNPEAVPLPDWLPRDSWLEWCQHRRDKGKTITQLAASKQIKQLAEYRDQGHEPTAVIDHCIANGYQGLFPPRSTTNEASGRHRKETPLEAGVRELQEMRERIANGNIIEWLNQDGPLPFG